MLDSIEQQKLVSCVFSFVGTQIDLSYLYYTAKVRIDKNNKDHNLFKDSNKGETSPNAPITLILTEEVQDIENNIAIMSTPKKATSSKIALFAKKTKKTSVSLVSMTIAPVSSTVAPTSSTSAGMGQRMWLFMSSTPLWVKIISTTARC